MGLRTLLQVGRLPAQKTSQPIVVFRNPAALSPSNDTSYPAQNVQQAPLTRSDRCLWPSADAIGLPILHCSPVLDWRLWGGGSRGSPGGHFEIARDSALRVDDGFPLDRWKDYSSSPRDARLPTISSLLSFQAAAAAGVRANPALASAAVAMHKLQSLPDAVPL